MKKILLTVVALLTVFAANAQNEVKSVPAATKSLASAKEAVNNPKKNTKAATWIKYGQALIDAYNAPAGEILVGMGSQELDLIGFKEKPLKEEEVTVADVPYTKKVYADKNIYFASNGQVAIIEVTNPIEKDALPLAVEAFAKAVSIDGGAKTVKDATEGIKMVNEKLNSLAITEYSLNDLNESSVCFEKAAEALATAPVSALDTNAVYNAGLTAFMGGNMDRAKVFFQKSIENNYFGTDGDVYYKLSVIADKQNDAEGSKAILKEGFEKFPQSQSILIGLINYYVKSGEGADELFSLLDKAKKNDPKNASLYYVEGNAHKNLGDLEAASAAYDKCYEIDPTYNWGYIGKGIMFYEKAIEYQDLASKEMDDAKWSELSKKFEESLKSCIEPFEKAYELSTDPEVKRTVSEYLKNACFRFRGESDEYQQKYEKYAAAAE